MSELKKDEITGLFYYENLPDIFRIGTLEDFSNLKQMIQDKKPFLMLSYVTGRYECYRVSFFFEVHKLNPWLNDNKVFVLK